MNSIHRRGSTNQSVNVTAPSLAVGQQHKGGASTGSAGQPRVVQQGTWTPKGVAARLVYAACSDAGCSLDGHVKTNQDSFMAVVPHPFGSTALFTVFDGHGEHGHLVSRQAVSEFGRLLHQEQARRPDVRSALASAFLEQDRSCSSSVDCSQSGTTAVTCFLRADQRTGAVGMHAAWVGDSRAVMAVSYTHLTLPTKA